MFRPDLGKYKRKLSGIKFSKIENELVETFSRIFNEFVKIQNLVFFKKQTFIGQKMKVY